MIKLAGVKPKKVFEYFEKISAIPRGSGDMERISDYCVNFATEHKLRVIRDDANNVVIFKDGTEGYEKSEPVILQGHLDMVCQKTTESNIDFLNEGLDLYIDGDFIKARGTTLGADDGIAVAMIMAVLDSDEIEHPPIEAVFTTDEEIGLIGAGKLDMTVLAGKKMINIDSEDPSVLTVSCAGGSDFKLSVEFERKIVHGRKVEFTLKGLQGGHSGVCINMGRVNADTLMGRVLNSAKTKIGFDVAELTGGDKGNAIPLVCKADLVSENAEELANVLKEYTNVVKEEIAAREPNFEYSIEIGDENAYSVMEEDAKNRIIYALTSTPDGVQKMSAEISGLVETSLNLGVLKTRKNSVDMQYALRSNKQSALCALEEKMNAFATFFSGKVETSGHYPPWEYRDNSKLQSIYKEAYAEKFGEEPEVVAIHAGLECGLFSSAIDDIDCISVGPLMNNIHTVNEELSISSTEEMFEILKSVLKKCK